MTWGWENVIFLVLSSKFFFVLLDVYGVLIYFILYFILLFYFTLFLYIIFFGLFLFYLVKFD